MTEKEIDFKKLDQDLIDIYNSNKRPNKIIEKKLRDVITNDEN